jgi:hypothetical protein
MALRRQSFDITMDLPTSTGAFMGTLRSTVHRAGSGSRPGRLLGYRLVDDALTGRGCGFTVREVALIDGAGDGSADDETVGRVVVNVCGFETQANDKNHSYTGFTPLAQQGHDVDGSTTTAGTASAVYFSTKKLEVEVFGGGAATDTITIELLFETAGDYRF